MFKALAQKIVVGLLISCGCSHAQAESRQLELLWRQGPWPAVSGLIEYGDRIWFANSVKFENHNSADIYSYEPQIDEARYERHLFSQDAGDPMVANGLLFWPFEDPRFSSGLGEFAITNGSDWQWKSFTSGQAFHVHAMAASGNTYFAATSAWRAGLQRSDDGGQNWRVVYDHPTPERRVSRLTKLAFLDDVLYAGLTSAKQRGPKLMWLNGNALSEVKDWPVGTSTVALHAYTGWLYAVNRSGKKLSVWRTNGKRVQRVKALNKVNVRAFASGRDGLWAISGRDKGGRLWFSRDGLKWSPVQTFENAEPVDIAVYANQPYVGTIGPSDTGGLWGYPSATRVEPKVKITPLPDKTVGDVNRRFGEIDKVTSTTTSFADLRQGLQDVLPLALTHQPSVGAALAKRLTWPQPDKIVSYFGDQYKAPLADMNQWFLLWGISLNGHGRVPTTLLNKPWRIKENPSQKYFSPAPAAMWAVSMIGQNDFKTIDTLINQLDVAGQPLWFIGDVVGALTAITGQRFAYDIKAWRKWWQDHAANYAEDMILIPAGTLAMGSDAGEPAERPVHKVEISEFLIDRFETTNKQFAEFVDATGHVTDVERAGWGWHWYGQPKPKWRKLNGASWRQPAGAKSSIRGRDSHPVVQVSWHDANAYCAWRNKRLPTEAEWERAARGSGFRQYAWGNTRPRIGNEFFASYGTDACCDADDADGHLTTAPVGSFPGGQSPFGVQDMTGNVWEWTQDSYDEDFYQDSPVNDPVNKSDKNPKLIRGGGWGNNPEGLRTTLRHWNKPEYGLSMVGFRCAR